MFNIKKSIIVSVSALALFGAAGAVNNTNTHAAVLSVQQRAQDAERDDEERGNQTKVHPHINEYVLKMHKLFIQHKPFDHRMPSNISHFIPKNKNSRRKVNYKNIKNKKNKNHARLHKTHKARIYKSHKHIRKNKRIKVTNTRKRRNRRIRKYRRINKKHTRHYIKRNRIHMIKGTKANHKQGERAGRSYGNYYQNNLMNNNMAYSKSVKELAKMSRNKLYNRAFISGFADGADDINRGDEPISFESLVALAQQYKASHYNPKIIRTINYLVKKTGGGDGDFAREYGNHHLQCKTVAYDVASLIDVGTL